MFSIQSLKLQEWMDEVVASCYPFGNFIRFELRLTIHVQSDEVGAKVCRRVHELTSKGIKVNIKSALIDFECF